MVLFGFGMNIMGSAVMLGYISHLFLDGLSVQGIKPLGPFISKRIRGFVKVGGVFENVFFVFLDGLKLPNNEFN